MKGTIRYFNKVHYILHVVGIYASLSSAHDLLLKAEKEGERESVCERERKREREGEIGIEIEPRSQLVSANINQLLIIGNSSFTTTNYI